MITRSGLASENNGIAQTGVTLFYTINPFGPSGGGAFLVSFLSADRWNTLPVECCQAPYLPEFILPTKNIPRVPRRPSLLG